MDFITLLRRIFFTLDTDTMLLKQAYRSARSAVRVADVTTSNKFLDDRSRGVDSVVEVENCPLPLTKPVAVNTGLALPRSA